MDGIEEVGEDDEVVAVGQPDTSGARAASQSRSFAKRLRQRTVQANRVKKSTARKTSAPNSRRPAKTDLPARARTAAARSSPSPSVASAVRGRA
eukprot:15346085-Alexandrium_andersonii.AAC.1